VRDRDGLALSSRNGRLSPGERQSALALHRSLLLARAQIAAGERDPTAARRRALGEIASAGVDLDYFELVDPDTLSPVVRIDDQHQVLAVVAARVGATRLIDNDLIQVPSVSTDGGEQQVATAVAAPTG
jgi:pantoate--beta-alanine ligase